MAIGHNLDFGLLIMVVGIHIKKEIQRMASKKHQKLKMGMNIHFVWDFLLDQVTLGVEIVLTQENVI